MTEDLLYKKIRGQGIASFDDDTKWEMARISYVLEVLDEANQDFPKPHHEYKAIMGDNIMLIPTSPEEYEKWKEKWFGGNSA